MTRIDLLPSRYHQYRLFEKQLYWGLVGLAGVLVLIGTVGLAMQASAVAYERKGNALLTNARQYRTINQRFAELQQAEQTLMERKSKAVPYQGKGESVLGPVEDFTRGLPTNIKLRTLTVQADGKVELKGEARSFNDTARLVKWLGATAKYQDVALTEVGRGGDKLVTFSIAAVRPGQGGAQQ